MKIDLDFLSIKFPVTDRKEQNRFHFSLQRSDSRGATSLRPKCEASEWNCERELFMETLEPISCLFFAANPPRREGKKKSYAATEMSKFILFPSRFSWLSSVSRVEFTLAFIQRRVSLSCADQSWEWTFVKRMKAKRVENNSRMLTMMGFVVGGSDNQTIVQAVHFKFTDFSFGSFTKTQADSTAANYFMHNEGHRVNISN